MDWFQVIGQGSRRTINNQNLSCLTSLIMIFLVLLVLAVSSSLGSASPSTPAPHTLQEITHRLDMILNNTRSRENYIRCFMDRGICNKEASNIKRILSEALAVNCTNCTQAQRLGAERFFEYLQAHQPDTWESLRGKYGGRWMKDDDDSESDDDDDDDDDDKMDNKRPQGAAGGVEATGNNQTSSKVQTTTTMSKI